MELVKVDAGVWIEVSKVLPMDGSKAIVKTNYHKIYETGYYAREWNKFHFMFKDEAVTHWLKPFPQSFVLTKNELIKVAIDFLLDTTGDMFLPNAEELAKQFLKSITK